MIFLSLIDSAERGGERRIKRRNFRKFEMIFFLGIFLADILSHFFLHISAKLLRNVLSKIFIGSSIELVRFSFIDGRNEFSGC